MDYISYLPPELIEHILTHEDISPKDVENLGLTCKILYYNIWEIKNDKLFRSFFFKRWPILRVMCDVKWQKNGTNIRKQLRNSLKFEKKFSEHFSEFVHKMEYHFNLKEMVYFMEIINRIFNKHEGKAYLHYYYLQEELMTIIAKNRDKYDNLTETYYAKQLLLYVKHRHLEKEWQEFIKLPTQKQPLERAATIPSQWCQPEKRLLYLHVSSMLNNIRHEVLIQLQKEHPSHPVFLVSPTQFSFWERNNIGSHYWDATETRQIINVMRKCIFNIFGCHTPLNGSSTTNNPINYFIDTVLEKRRGSHLLVSLIFGCVARRLGVRCDLRDAYVHRSPLLLSWKENYDVVNPEYGTYYSIKVFQDGPIVSWDADYLGEPINFIEQTHIIDASQLISYMNNVEFIYTRRNPEHNITIRLFKYFNYIMERGDIYKLKDATQSLLWNKNPYVDLTEYWSLLNRDATEIMNNDKAAFCDNVARFEKRLLWQSCIKPKKRTKAIKYAIGTCIQIEDHGQRISGVIIAWDEKFVNVSDPFVIGQFIKMGSKSMQPFYKILCCDNISLYVGEDIITPQNLDAPITHHEIGRYFKKFMGTHYEPNGFLDYNYPDDIFVRKKAARILN